MAFNIKKNIVVGVSVNPNIGLEVAQVDYTTRTVLKYASKTLDYDNARKQIADMDVFKETLRDLFIELEIPKGSEIVVNLPSVVFKVTDYPASLNEAQITAVIEEELSEHPLFQQSMDIGVSAVALPNSTIQFTKVAYTAMQKSMLIELAMQIKDLGYKLIAIDSSVNSTLNALIYNDRVNTSPDVSWIMLQVENSFCRIILMQGKNYVDCYEEKISIGEVLEDEENYATVVNAVNPILKNLPSQCLYVVSKTNIISAKVLASKLIYNAQIIHQEANHFATEPFIDVEPGIDSNTGCLISLDVIGAAVQRNFAINTNAHFNLFNESLGDVYTSEQPLALKLGSRTFVMSMENMITLSIILTIIVVAICAFTIIPINATIAQKQEQISKLKNDIMTIQQYLNENKDVSSELFDEGDEIRVGLINNKNIYKYYTIVGTEIPQKLWLTSLSLGKNITIEGQADNLESVYAFFRNTKDYQPDSKIKLQKLGLATNSKLTELNSDATFDTKSILTSMTADFYEFRISDAPEIKKDSNKDNDVPELSDLPELEPNKKK